MAVLVADEWRRRGLVSGVETLGGLLTCTWSGPPSSHGLFEGSPEILLVGIDVEDGWDRYAGLTVLAAVRPRERVRPHPPTTVGIAWDLSNPLIAVRAAEVRLDLLCSWREIADLAGLERVLLTPPLGWSPGERMDFEALRHLGVPPNACLTRALEHIQRAGLQPDFEGVEAASLTRRQRITLRRTLAEVSGIRAVEQGSAASNQPVFPSWQQLRSVMNSARGA